MSVTSAILSSASAHCAAIIAMPNRTNTRFFFIVNPRYQSANSLAERMTPGPREPHFVDAWPLPGHRFSIFSCRENTLPYPADTGRQPLLDATYARRAVGAFDLQIVGAEHSVAHLDLRIVDVVYPAAVVVDLPDLAVVEPNARSRLPAFEMTRNEALDSLRRRLVRFVQSELFALTGLGLADLLFARQHHERVIARETGGRVRDAAASQQRGIVRQGRARHQQRQQEHSFHCYPQNGCDTKAHCARDCRMPRRAGDARVRVRTSQTRLL